MSAIRVGDLVTWRDNVDTGIVIKIKKREVASPHPNYKGKHPPLELKVVEYIEVMWAPGHIDVHDSSNLKRVKKERKK